MSEKIELTENDRFFIEVDSRLTDLRQELFALAVIPEEESRSLVVRSWYKGVDDVTISHDPQELWRAVGYDPPSKAGLRYIPIWAGKPDFAPTQTDVYQHLASRGYYLCGDQEQSRVAGHMRGSYLQGYFYGFDTIQRLKP